MFPTAFLLLGAARSPDPLRRRPALRGPLGRRGLHCLDPGLRRSLKANPNDIEALWRKARSLYGKGEVMANNGASAATRIQMYSEVTALSERILAIDPSHGQGHHWKGAGLGRTATAKGVLSSLFMADDIESSWLTT